MNKLKRMTLGTLAGLAAAGVSFGAIARGRHGHHMHGHGHGPEGIERMVKHLAVELDATPEQQEKLVAIAKQAAKDLEPLRGQALETRKQAVELLSQPSIDRAALEKLRASKLERADAASRRVTQALADAAEVLDPEQRKKLAEHVGRMGMRRRHRHWG